MNGGYTEDRPLTEAERLVNVHYLGHCLHENRRVWNNWSMGWCSRCRDCLEEIQIQGYSQAKHLPADVLAQAWSREHIKTAASPINGAQLRYALESEGWCVRFLGMNGRTLCEVQKGAAILRSAFFGTQAEAVVEACAMTLKNYIPRYCAHRDYLVQSTH